MLKTKYIIFILCLFSFISNLYFLISIVTFIVIFSSFISAIGKKLLLAESISLYSCIIYLIAPILGYTEYVYDNPLVKIWDIYMKVGEIEYYSFALPAILVFVLALYSFDSSIDKQLLKLTTVAKSMLLSKKRIALNLLILGTISFYIRMKIPIYLNYPLTILYLSAYSGLLYIYFNANYNKVFKLGVLSFFGIWLILNSILQGMFTILIYMGISIFGIIMLGKNVSFFKKLALIIIISFFTLVLQYTKSNYRTALRRGLVTESNFKTFINLYTNNLKESKNAFNYDAFFPIYIRINQGYHLSCVMDNMPKRRSFDKGKRLAISVLASFIPRIFWPDKPKSGGKANMLYYADVFLDTTSMNVGPIGEAYGSFGKWGGIFYMFLFGSVIGLSFRFFITLCIKYPLLLYWQPMIFYEVIYCMENDTMQALNSLIKTGFMLFIMFKLFPSVIVAKQNNLG